jgi:hypothetical protein
VDATCRDLEHRLNQSLEVNVSLETELETLQSIRIEKQRLLDELNEVHDEIDCLKRSNAVPPTVESMTLGPRGSLKQEETSERVGDPMDVEFKPSSNEVGSLLQTMLSRVAVCASLIMALCCLVAPCLHQKLGYLEFILNFFTDCMVLLWT